MAAWVTKSNFAKTQEVKLNTVSNWTRRPDGPLVAALNSTGDKIDMDHPCVAEFLESQARAADRRTVASKRSLDTDSGSFSNFEHVKNMTVGEVAKQYGGLPMFMEYIKAFNGLQDGRKKELSNLRTEGTLVSRELVRAAVLTHVDRIHRRLLTDFSETIVTVLYNMCKAGETPEVAKMKFREEVGVVLGSSMDRVIRGFTELTEDGVSSDDSDSDSLESGSECDTEAS